MNTDDAFQQKFRDLIQLFDIGIDDIDIQSLDMDAKELLTERNKSDVSRVFSKLSADSDAKAVLYHPGRHLRVDVDINEQYDVYRLVTIHRVKHEERNVPFWLIHGIGRYQQTV